MRSIQLKRKTIYCISFCIVILDQASKYFALTKENQVSSQVIPGLIDFQTVRNYGAAFSIFSEWTFMLTIISILVSIILVIYISTKYSLVLSKGLAFAFLLGGSLGNCIDRVRLGFVVDFIDFTPINFPIFNLADISINLAIIFFILDLIVISDKRSTR